MVKCFNSSLTVAALACIKPYQAQDTFDGITYAPLMYKIIMHLATIDSVVTTAESHRKNLNNLPFYAASVTGNVDMITLTLMPTTPRS